MRVLMNYTALSLALFWLSLAAVVGLSATGTMTGVGLLMLVLTALAAPALILRKSV